MVMRACHAYLFMLDFRRWTQRNAGAKAFILGLTGAGIPYGSSGLLEFSALVILPVAVGIFVGTRSASVLAKLLFVLAFGVAHAVLRLAVSSFVDDINWFSRIFPIDTIYRRHWVFVFCFPGATTMAVALGLILANPSFRKPNPAVHSTVPRG